MTVHTHSFVVKPYLQNPTHDGMTLIWFSAEGTPGLVDYVCDGYDKVTLESKPVLATALSYHPSELALLPKNARRSVPYRHRVRLSGLQPDTLYTYTVMQGDLTYRSSFQTSPGPDTPIRFIVYADSETEPESTEKNAKWKDPTGQDEKRLYLVNQTICYYENLRVIASRDPSFIAIVGDLVESGGEQRDWDEFWRHNAGALGEVASHVPILPALGNHENYGGPGDFGRYSTTAAIAAVEKYRCYFELPKNGALITAQEGRYYRIDYGPVTLITLDSSNGGSNGTETDTNFLLKGDGEGGVAPDFNPGSPQYTWLEAQLEDARTRSKFIFIQLHHAPYSVGPHGLAPGREKGFDTQSGVPIRVLTPLFMKYGVAAVFSGHDEIFERSVLEGNVSLANGATRIHNIHFYDVGIGGDDLRGPNANAVNLHQVWLAHRDAPEIYKDGLLIEGGKHYGHLEVDVNVNKQGRWQATLSPVYVFPVMTFTETGEVRVQRFERRIYNDVVTILSTVLE